MKQVIAILTTLAAVGLGITAKLHRGRRAPDTAVVSTSAAQPERNTTKLSEAEIRDSDIAFYERRAKQDSTSAGDRTQLAMLYMDRARSTGAFSDYQRAEALARRSLSLRSARNGQAFSILAAALLARHDFVDAH